MPRIPLPIIGCIVLSLVLVTVVALWSPWRQPSSNPAITAKDQSDGSAFLAKNGKDPAVKTLSDGLQYKVIRSGPPGAPSPKKGDEIKINYVGSLVDGQVFDSTDKLGQPAVMTLDNLVPGWMEALPLMHVGDAWYIYLPPKLGYGERGAGGVIPPNAVLVFKIELLGVLPAGGPSGTANG